MAKKQSRKFRQSHVNMFMAIFLLGVKLLGTYNMAMDTYDSATAGIDIVSAGVMVRALVKVLLIDVTMLAFWSHIDYSSDSKDNRLSKIPATLLVWAMFIGQLVIGANQSGVTGVVSRIAVGGGLTVSTIAYLTKLWNTMREVGEKDKRSIPQRMKAMRESVWNGVYMISFLNPLVFVPLVLIASVKLVSDMVRDSAELGKHYEPLVKRKQPASVGSQKQIKRSASTKAKKGNKKALPDAVLLVENGLWFMRCPVCPEWESRRSHDRSSPGKAYGGHRGQKQHKLNEVAYAASKVLNGNPVN